VKSKRVSCFSYCFASSFNRTCSAYRFIDKSERTCSEGMRWQRRLWHSRSHIFDAPKKLRKAYTNLDPILSSYLKHPARIYRLRYLAATSSRSGTAQRERKRQRRAQKYNIACRTAYRIIYNPREIRGAMKPIVDTDIKSWSSHSLILLKADDNAWEEK